MKNFNLLLALLMLLPGAVLCSESNLNKNSACQHERVESTAYVLQFLAHSKDPKNDNWLDRIAKRDETASTRFYQDKPHSFVSGNFILKNTAGSINITADIVHSETYNSLPEDQVKQLKAAVKNAQEFREKDTYTRCIYVDNLYLDEQNNSVKTTLTSKCSTVMDYAMLMSLLVSKPHNTHNDL